MGLLPRDNEEQVSFAYALYKRIDEEGDRLAEGFKNDFCTSVKIEFIGVWSAIRPLRHNRALIQLQGDCGERWIHLRPHSPIHILEPECEGIQTCPSFG